MIHKKQKGFTILELILSIFILSVAVAGIFSSFALMVILASGASDKLTAVYLAKEGLELTVNIRDTNWKNNDNWQNGLYPDCTNGCQIDYKMAGQNTEPKQWGSAGDYFSSDNGFYVYSSLNRNLTKFKRKITVTQLTEDTVKVLSEVFWDQKASVLNPSAKRGSFSMELVLYNWQKAQ